MKKIYVAKRDDSCGSIGRKTAGKSATKEKQKNITTSQQQQRALIRKLVPKPTTA